MITLSHTPMLQCDWRLECDVRKLGNVISKVCFDEVRNGAPGDRLKQVTNSIIMYTLLHGFYKYLVQKDEYFVLILGLDNAGKTTYLEAAKTKFTKNYKGMNPSKITTTVGLNIGKIDIHGVRLNFWDLGGQEELQSLWDKYYAESHAVIYIVDSSDRERIPDSKETFDRVISSEHLTGVPLLVLANKQDIIDSMGIREVKPIFNQNAHLIGRRDCMVMPVSALTGDGVDEGIHWLVDCVKRNSDVRPPRNQDENCLS